jgi:hypothetical protein
MGVFKNNEETVISQRSSGSGLSNSLIVKRSKKLLDMWIEVLKILGPSALMAVVLAYVLNKKLENYKMLLKVNEQSLLLMVNGLHLLMNDYRAIVLKVGEVRRLIEKHKYPEEQIHELSVLKQQYESTLRGHRIYLAPLYSLQQDRGKIPFL